MRVSLDDPENSYGCFHHILGHGAWTVNGPLIERFCPPLSPGIAERFAWSKNVTDEQVVAAYAHREQFKKQLADLLGTDGVLVMPTVADIATLITDSGEKMEGHCNRSHQMLCVAGLLGFPQISPPLPTPGCAVGLVVAGPGGQ